MRKKKIGYWVWVGTFALLAWTFGVAAEEKEPWVGNKIGLDHTVPIPWTPMKIEKSKVSCWGRVTDFDGQALPCQITTQNIPLLMAPIKLSMETEKDIWKDAVESTGRCVEKGPDRIVWDGKMMLEGIPVMTRVVVEFDGFTWVTLRLGPASKVKVKRIALEIPLAQNIAKYYTKEFEGYAPSLLLDMWGQVSRSRKLKMQEFTLANEDVGISFFQEGKQGWLLERKDRQLEWVKEDDRVIVRLNLVDVFVPKVLDTERVISFGWNALPVKPMMPDGRRYLVYTIGGDPNNFYTSKILASGMTTVGIRLTYYIPECKLAQMTEEKRKWLNLSYVPIDIPRPANPDGFKEYIKIFHAAGPSKVVIYTVGNHHNVLDPVFYRHFDEWSGTDAVMNETILADIKAQEGQFPGSRHVCGWSSFVDYKVWFMTYWFKELGLDGYYYDNQCFRPCENSKHTAHQFVDDQGQRIVVEPLLRYRETYKRIYREIKRIKPDSIIVGHGCKAAYPFVDIAIGGEALQKLAGATDYYTAFVTAEDCKNPMFTGRQMGLPYLWLPEYRGKYAYGDEAVKPARAMLSLIWMADASYWVAWSHTSVLCADAGVRGSFKIWESEHLPFWSQNVVNVNKEGVFVSVYRKPKSALLVVSNPGKTAWNDLVLSVDMDKLFSGHDLRNVTARDAEYEEYLKLSFKPEYLKTNFKMESEPLKIKHLVAVEKSYVDIPLSIADQDLRIIKLEVPE